MKRTVFYSWQSDLPNSTNRSFIETVLERATASIAADDTVEVEPVIDRDTLGVAGSPDISATIFNKIEQADVFVADVTIIGRLHNNRPVPNPNVLIELGYAIKSLDYTRVILVFNLAYGTLLDLPFDLRTRRILTYHLEQNKTEKSEERIKLTISLKAAITAAVMVNRTEPLEVPLFDLAVSAIEAQQPNRMISLQKELHIFLKQLEAKQPDTFSQGGTVQNLIDAINDTVALQARFAKLCYTIAVMEDSKAALQIHKWFGQVIERYHLPRDFQGKYKDEDFDYYKFLGHELYTLFVAPLLKEEKWLVIQELFGNWIPLDYYRPLGQAYNATLKDVSKSVDAIYYEGEKTKKLSLEASMIKEHFQNQELSAYVSFDDFMNADLFLFMSLELKSPKPDPQLHWRPVTMLFMNSTPGLLLKAQRINFAYHLALVCGVKEIPEFKQRLLQRLPKINNLFVSEPRSLPVSHEDIERISSTHG